MDGTNGMSIQTRKAATTRGLKSITGISMLILLNYGADRIPAGLQAYVASMLGPAFLTTALTCWTHTQKVGLTPIFVLFPV